MYATFVNSRCIGKVEEVRIDGENIGPTLYAQNTDNTLSSVREVYMSTL